VRFLSLLGAGVLLCCGCGPGPRSRGPENGGNVLRIGNATEPQTLDPHQMMDLQQIAIGRGLFEGLVTLDDHTLEPLPGAAMAWEISEDGLVYTFHLRPDGRWSDGSPVTAGDFIYAFRRILSPQLASPTAELLFPVARARDYYGGRVDWESVGVRAPDNLCLEITLERPTPYFLSLLTHPAWSPLSRANVEIHGPSTRQNSSWTRPGSLVSNGPYRLVNWRVGDRVTLEKNPHHWRDLTGAPDAVVFYAIADSSTEQNAFENGELDVTATIPPDRIDAMRHLSPETLQEIETIGVFYYLLRCDRGPLMDRHLRRALALAIDRRELCRLLHRDPRFAAESLVPRNVGGYAYGGHSLSWDPAAARKELALAGFGPANPSPPLVLALNSTPSHLLIAQAVQEMWRRELGIDVELLIEEWKSFLLTRRAGNFAIARGGWIGDYNDPLTFLDNFRGAAVNNFSRWHCDAYDRALEAASGTLERRERFHHFQEAEAILLEEVPAIPLYFETSKHRVSPLVRGWHPNILDYHLYQNIRLP
jgi:oligopeptide transport system substrate-binding protein